VLVSVRSSPHTTSKARAAAACGGPSEGDARAEGGPGVSAARLGEAVVARVAPGPVVASCSSVVAGSEGSCRRGATVGDGRCRLLSRLGLPARGDRLHDQPDLVLPCCLGQDCRVPQHTVVQGILRLLCLLPIAVLDESNAVGQVETEVHERSVLLAEGLQGGPIDLGGQVLQQQPAARLGRLPWSRGSRRARRSPVCPVAPPAPT